MSSQISSNSSTSWLSELSVIFKKVALVSSLCSSLNSTKFPDAAGLDRIGVLSEEAFLVAGVALYAGEGSKRDGVVEFTNSDPAMIRFFCAWLRGQFDIDESKLRVSIYLHQGLDLEAASTFWARTTAVPLSQFLKPYRPVPSSGIRLAKHVYGCASIRYYSARVHREIMGMVRALLCETAIPG